MATIPLPRDFKEFLRLFGDHEVRYLLVGGYAVGLHGHVRGTADIDLWVDRAGENPDRIVSAVREFGFENPELRSELFREPGHIVRMGVPPLRIEIMTSVSGVDFEECYEQRELRDWDGVPIAVISLGMLKRNKQAAGRPKDLDDLEHLKL